MSGFNDNGIEEDPQKILNQLLIEMRIEKVYDEETNKTTLTITFPEWLGRDYQKCTVNQFTRLIKKQASKIISATEGVEPI